MADLFSAPTPAQQHTTSGFPGAPVSKLVTGLSVAGHVALHIPMFANTVKNMLYCHLPRLLEKSDSSSWWRLFTSKLIFFDTKDTIFCLILLYQFRVFERRFGSRKFSSHILANWFFTAVFEVLLTQLYLSSWSTKPVLIPPGGSSSSLQPGVLAMGPFGLILPLFVEYFCDIPNLSGSTFGGIAVSSKSMFYIMGAQIAFSSNQNTIVFIAAILSGIFVRKNMLWVQKWFQVPSLLASITDKLFGWLVRSSSSGPAGSELLGATLEIQRAQQVELMEQRIIRQQQAMFDDGGNRRRVNRMGQGFQEQLVNNQGFFPPLPEAAGGAAGAFFRGAGGLRAPGGRRAAENPAAAAAAVVEPSEENVQMLVDMGFQRERVLRALRQSGNDVQSATAILLHGADNF